MKKVLFVCIENSSRSQLAEALTRQLGKGLVEAYSSGSRPSGQVNARAITAMQALGYDMSSHYSKPLSELPADCYDAVITMGCGDQCPMMNARYRADWAIPDPKALPQVEFNRIRDMIKDKVMHLLLELDKETFSQFRQQAAQSYED